MSFRACILTISTKGARTTRYISLPGQALAYKVGQLEIQRLRTEAEAAAGFSLRAFHDRLMELGTLPLTSLRREMSS